MDEGPPGIGSATRQNAVPAICGIRGTAIEERQCFPPAWFCCKYWEELDRYNRVSVADGGVLTQGGLILAEPNYERHSSREMMLRQRDSLLGIIVERCGVTSPGRVGRGSQPCTAHGSKPASVPATDICVLNSCNFSDFLTCFDLLSRKIESKQTVSKLFSPNASA